MARTRAVYTLFRQQPGLRDLARRPVLAGMVVESAAQLGKLGEHQISVRRLYELYTGRWVTLEEDKGSFRILLDPDKKSTFLRYLAMQMHLANTLSIHYRQIDRRIAEHFGLESSDTIDHFSHDVRTCSFLSRSDGGEYRFIHKSFMEYFVACEYERLDKSPYVDAFDKALTPEMQAFVELEKLAPEIPTAIALLQSKDVQGLIEKLDQQKETAVAEQDFEMAAWLRHINDIVKKLRGQAVGVFATMRREKMLVQPSLLALRKEFKAAKDTWPKDILTEFRRICPALLAEIQVEPTETAKGAKPAAGLK